MPMLSLVLSLVLLLPLKQTVLPGLHRLPVHVPEVNRNEGRGRGGGVIVSGVERWDSEEGRRTG